MAREAGGLVRDLGSASPDERLAAARALEQLAASPGGAQRIQRAGGVPALLRLLQGGEQSEELQIAAASALSRMAEREESMATDICRAGAGRAVAQCFSGSRSPAVTRALIDLLGRLHISTEQQLGDELAASPSFLQRLAQLAVDSSQDAYTQSSALTLLAGHMRATSPSAVTAAVAPHAAAIVQHLPPTANGTSQAWVQHTSAARLVALLADESAELAATMVAAGALPRLVRLMRSSWLPLLRIVAVGALERLVRKQPSAAAHLAAVDGVTEALVQLLASHQPPASCQQAWDTNEACTSCAATALLMALSRADAGQTCRAVAAGALPQLTRLLRWGAQRLEWLGRRRGPTEEVAQGSCATACVMLFSLLWDSGASSAATSAVQAELPQLLQLVLQHSRDQDALRAASRLLALLRDPDNECTQALDQGAAEVLRQLQPGGQPDRAAAIAALLSELTSGAQQQQAGGSGAAAAAPAGPSSGGAAAQAGRQTTAVPAECAACKALPPAGRKFQVCAGCRAVRYCSPACQKAAWRSGHKAACREKGGAGAKG
jgi:hypothetical protein